MLSETLPLVGADLGASPARQTIVALAQRRAGVIERIASLLRRRAPTFTTLTVAQCESPTQSRVTIGFEGAPMIAQQLVEHLRKLVDVSAVTLLTPAAGQEGAVVRELALARITCSPQNRRELIDIAHLFGARALAVDEEAITLEICGDAATIDSVLLLARPFGVQSLTRTGGVALWRAPADDEAATPTDD